MTSAQVTQTLGVAIVAAAAAIIVAVGLFALAGSSSCGSANALSSKMRARVRKQVRESAGKSEASCGLHEGNE
jgi:hypothetical protein